MTTIDDIKDGKFCTNVKQFLFVLVGKCMSMKQQNNTIEMFNENIELVHTLEEIENENECIKNDVRCHKVVSKKRVVSCETKLHKIESILRRNRLKITSDYVTIKRINEILKGGKR